MGSAWLVLHRDAQSTVEDATRIVRLGLGGTILDGKASTSHAAAAAEDFDAALRSLSPAHFGTLSERTYVWHSMTGLFPKASVGNPHAPGEPLQAADCGEAVNAGPAYQRVWQDADDPRVAFFLMRAESKDRAMAFMARPESAKVGERAGVTGGTYHFVHEVGGPG